MENIVDFLAFRMVRKVISGLVFMLLLFLKPTPITHWIFLVVLCWFGGEVVHFIVSPKQRFAFRWGMLDLDTDMFPHDYLEAVALKEWAAKRLNDDALAFVKTYTSLNLVEAEHEKFLKRTPLSQKEMEEFRKNRRHLEEEISRLEGKRSAAQLLLKKRWELFSEMSIPHPSDDVDVFIQVVETQWVKSVSL